MARIPAMGGGGSEEYVLGETEIGTYCGQTLYRKVYRPNATINQTTKTIYIDTSLTNSNVKCINMYGNFTDGSSENSSPDFHYWSTNTDIGYVVIINATGVLFQTWNYTWTCRELVIEYVKIS